MTEQMEDGQVRLSVTPEPTEEELAAIVAVVTALAASLGPGEPGSVPQVDRWQLIGRHEALRGPLWSADMDGAGLAGRDDRR